MKLSKRCRLVRKKIKIQNKMRANGNDEKLEKKLEEVEEGLEELP